MLKSIEHRGRDDEGVRLPLRLMRRDGKIRLGPPAFVDHRHQQRRTPTDAVAGWAYVVTLNGEIYNYRELRDNSAQKSRLQTQSDTEVLLAAWAEWGTDCLSRLNGMFAFAIWDDRERTLTLVRDHVGIKPLYYAQLERQEARGGRDARGPSDEFLFASEVKAILASGLMNAQLDHESLHQFLTFLWVPDPNTLFRGIKTVPPGHYLTFKENQLSLHEWWDASFDEIAEGKNESWWQQETLETLDRVVRLEMVADVPLGSFLSGGIDSSGIVALMKQHSNGRRVGTYTIGIEPEDLRYDIIPDDVEWARKVTRIWILTNEIALQPQVAELLPQLVYHMDEPAIDMAIPSYCSRAARDPARDAFGNGW